jgi:hypothetical protein
MDTQFKVTFLRSGYSLSIGLYRTKGNDGYPYFASHINLGKLASSMESSIKKVRYL